MGVRDIEKERTGMYVHKITLHPSIHAQAKSVCHHCILRRKHIHFEFCTIACYNIKLIRMSSFSACIMHIIVTAITLHGVVVMFIITCEMLFISNILVGLYQYQSISSRMIKPSKIQLLNDMYCIYF